MKVKEDLIRIVGTEDVSEEPEVLKRYAMDNSLARPMVPNYVLQPKNAAEVVEITKLANETRVPLVPCSSGIHFHGNTIPVQGSVVVDLRRMNRILAIDERNRAVRIEPGVTWGQLQAELAKQDLMALNPLLPHPLKSALSSHLEVEPFLTPKFEYTDNVFTLEAVSPEGEQFRTGSAVVPGFPDKSFADGVNCSGPASVMWNRLFQGAQGTMGVVTWAQVKVEYRPKVNKTFFVPFDNLEDATKLVYKVQRRMIGQECLILNNFNLAAILAKRWPKDFDTLRRTLPPWMLLLVLGGGKRFPEDKIAYEEEVLREVAKELNIPDLPTAVPGLPRIEREIPSMLRTAWPEDRTYWKFAYRGTCQDLFFHTVMSKAAAFAETISEMAAEYDYSRRDIGFYIQPIVYGSACHFEANFYYNPDNADEVDSLRKLFVAAAEAVMERGGFFTRPYGVLGDMVYRRTAAYTAMLKRLKSTFDPNNVMAPGRLCF